MAYASGSTITCVIHGDKSPRAQARHDPTMKLKFTATITRNSSNVTVKLTGIKFWSAGWYGYKIRVGVKIGGVWRTLKTKAADQTKKSFSYSIGNKSYTYTNNTTNTPITVGAYAVDAKQCYVSSGHGWSNLTPINTYDFKTPPPNYIVTYDANGGIDAPAKREVPIGSPIINLDGELDADGNAIKPMYPLYVNYYQYDDSTIYTPVQINRPFTGWLAPNGNTYQIGASYTVTANCTMLAQWNPAIFTPQDLSSRSIRVYFHLNGGTGVPESPDSVPYYYEKLGYATEPDGTTYPYQPGTTYNITTNLYLYPKYEDTVKIHKTDLPTPTRKGYRFSGWYMDSELTISVPDNISTAVDIDLWAKWLQLPINQMSPNKEWESLEPLAWQCVLENGVKVWKQVAPIYKYNGTDWENISD